MRCAKCGNNNREGRKFCAKCGGSLLGLCPKCGAANEPGEDFCGECGASLAPSSVSHANPPRPAGPIVQIEADASSPALDGERKTVTALFADIKGSMELMEDLDPEEARAIVDPALKLMIDAVHHYGGYIVQSTGDGIFALFGAPVAHEDHPQRGLYAALRLQERLSHYSNQLRSQGRLPLQARVGLNTGEVVVRSIDTGQGHAEYTPIGHSTSLAARMQALAPIGSIAATDGTRKLCEGYFTFKSLGPTVVKGVTEPVNVYEVAGLGQLRTRLQSAVTRGLTKFVGRQREMDALKHASEQARTGHGQIVAVMADPGVGKSRLFYEFKAISQSGWMLLEAFSVSHGKASAYLPVLELLSQYFEIVRDDDDRKRCERVLGKVLSLDRTLEDTLPYLLSLQGIPDSGDSLAQMDPQIRRRRTQEALKRIFLRESLNQPLIMMFEDLHWIDAETQALLNVLVDAIGNARILLLVNYRPEEYRHEWGGRTHYTQLRLDPLGKESADEMLSALLGDEKHLVPLKRLIIERTQGTPFFMEEMVQALFEDGVLQRNGGVKLAKPIGAVKVPATVQAVLASRIDRLPPPEKELLQTLAVLGREFTLTLAQRVAGQSSEELEQTLSHLQLSEFINEQPAASDTEYAFKHSLTQEVAYNSVLFERRKVLHQQAAEAIEQLFADRLEDYVADLAHHYSRSTNIDKAVEYLRRAANHSLNQSLYIEARSALETAVALLDTSQNERARPSEQLRLLNLLAKAFHALEGGFTGPAAEAVLNRALRLIPVVNEPSQVQAALLGQWVFQTNVGRLDEARSTVNSMQDQATRSGSPGLIALTHLPAANTYFHLGEFETAACYGEEGVRLWRREYYDPAYWPGDPRVFGFCFRGRSLATMGYPDTGLACIRQALTIAKDEPSKFSYLVLLMEHACWFGVLICDLKLSRWMFEEARRLTDEIEYTGGVVRSHADWPRAIVTGEYGEALEKLDSVIEFEKKNRNLLFAHYYMAQSADLCMRAGLGHQGLETVQEALSFAQSSGARFNMAELWRIRGRLLLLPDVRDEQESRQAFERAIEIARSQKAKLLELRAICSLSRLLRDAGRSSVARTMLADIYDWFTEGFDTVDLKDAKALLDELSS